MSLPHARRHKPLDQREVRSLELEASALGMAGCALQFEPEAGSRTRFCLLNDEPTVVVGPDVFPGPNSYASANASLDPLPALAHELTHFVRWQSGRELPHGKLEEIDEAITSLQAILRHRAVLNEFHREQLIHDALERLEHFLANHPDLKEQE